MSDGNKVFAGLLIIGGLTTAAYFALRSGGEGEHPEPRWNVDDWLYCQTNGRFDYVVRDRRFAYGTWQYRLAEGYWEYEELTDWLSESYLYQPPYSCRLK